MTPYLIETSGALRSLGELSNAWAGQPRIWGPICQRFLGRDTAWMGHGSDQLWPLYKDERLPLHWRAALAMSFDYAIIEHARFREMADMLRLFDADTPQVGRLNHLPAIAALLDKHAGDGGLRGMCFHGTSVTANPWQPYDSEKDEPIPYDFDNPAGKHFYVLATVAPLAGAAQATSAAHEGQARGNPKEPSDG